MKTAIACLVLIFAAWQPAGATPRQAPALARAAAPRYAIAATPMRTLLDDPAVRAIVDRYIPDISTDRHIYFARKLPLKAIQPMSQGNITDRRLAAIDAALAELRRR